MKESLRKSIMKTIPKPGMTEAEYAKGFLANSDIIIRIRRLRYEIQIPENPQRKRKLMEAIKGK